MNLIKKMALCLIFLLSNSNFAKTNDAYLIQFGEKYLTLDKAVIKKNLRLETKNNQLMLKRHDQYYPINKENIEYLFDRPQLTLDFKDTFSNAEVYLDKYLQGRTNGKGFAHFSQIYPEPGRHTLNIKHKNMTLHPYDFELETATIIFCAGKSTYKCNRV